MLFNVNKVYWHIIAVNFRKYSQVLGSSEPNLSKNRELQLNMSLFG